MRPVILWLGDNWTSAITAIATAATALFVWLDRRDRRKQELPFVECTTGSMKDQPEWTIFRLVVRNFNPHSVHVDELRLIRPKRGVILSSDEAFKSNLPSGQSKFVGDNRVPRLRAAAHLDLAPEGVSGRFSSAVHYLEFYFSPGPGVTGRVKVKMALICEVRSRAVLKKEIVIKRSITL